MNFIKVIIFSLSCLLLNFCNNSAKQPDEISPKYSTVDSLDNKRTDDIKAIYFNVPSTMATAIILKDAGAIYDENLPLDPEKAQDHYPREELALLLGIYGADLNYSIVSNKNNETMFYLNSTNIIGEKLGLGNILNEEVKDRVDNNISREDSMQVIISEIFWKVESSLKEDGRGSISALVVAGGWIEGLYIATQLSHQLPENKKIKTIIAEQKGTISNLISLLDSYKITEHTKDILVTPIKELETYFNNVNEKILSKEHDADENDIPVVGLNIERSLDQAFIDKIRVSVEQIRVEITH